MHDPAEPGSAAGIVNLAAGMDVVLVECADETELAQVFARVHASPAHQLVLPFRHRTTAAALLESTVFLGIQAQCVSGREVLRTWTNVGRATSDEPITVNEVGSAVAGRAAVLALGQDAVALAVRFGRLTGRPVVAIGGAGMVRGFTELRDARSLTIVPTLQWTSGDLVALLDARRASGCAVPMGFLYPFGEPVRELFALKAVLFDRFFHQGRGRYRFLYPIETRSAAFEVGDADVLVGYGQSPTATEKLLESRADFLFAAPHSNGVNMGLGAVVLCALQDRPEGVDTPSRSLPCFSEAPCSRKRPTNLLLAPSSVRSAVVFLYTCWGVLLSDATFDVATSLAACFASSPYTAALLTTPGLSLLDRASGLFVADLLRTGVPLGTASADFNRRHFQRYSDNEDITVLFGDPELAIGAGAGTISAQLEAHAEFASFASATGLHPYRIDQEPSADRGSRPFPAPGRTDAYFALDYARCVVAGSRGLRRPELTSAVDMLATRVDELWPIMLAVDARAAQAHMAGMPARLVTDRDRRIAQLQEAWLNYFRTLAGTLGGYVRLQTDRYFQSVGELASRVSCPYCAGPARAIKLQMAGATGGTRSLVECVACATVLDALPPISRAVLHGPDRAELGDLLTLSLEIGLDPAVAAAGASHVAALAILEPFNKGASGELVESTVLRYRVTPTKDEIRLPTISLFIPENLVPGVYYVDAIVLFGMTPAVLRRSLVVTTSHKSHCAGGYRD